MTGEALRVCVTGAAGQISYSLLGSIIDGSMFGTEQPVVLLLLDIEPAMGVLKGRSLENTRSLANRFYEARPFLRSRNGIV
jgi:hypothetical protein